MYKTTYLSYCIEYNPLKEKEIGAESWLFFFLLTSYFITAIYKHSKIKIMTYQEANHISIKDYLKSLGILPAVDKYYYGMYHSPFRQDDTPSFKVDYGVNLWCDFDAPI